MFAQDGGITGQKQRTAAEVFNLQAKLGQRLALFQSLGRLLGRQFHRLRNQHSLTFKSVRLEPFFQLLE